MNRKDIVELYRKEGRGKGGGTAQNCRAQRTRPLLEPRRGLVSADEITFQECHSGLPPAGWGLPPPATPATPSPNFARPGPGEGGKASAQLFCTEDKLSRGVRLRGKWLHIFVAVAVLFHLLQVLRANGPSQQFTHSSSFLVFCSFFVIP